MDEPTLFINGHPFIAGKCLSVAGRIELAPPEVLQILLTVNQQVLDKTDLPDWVDVSATREMVRAVRREIALRRAGFLPLVVAE